MICKFNTQNNNKKVIWEITNKCNYNCQYCIFNTNDNTKDLSLEDCKKIIDQLIDNGFDYIKFTGGEPFVRKDFIEILKYANKKIKFDISTNASLLTPEIVKDLQNIDINFIHISIDGLEDAHNFIRGKNTFIKTINGLKLLKSTDNYIRIGCVLYKYNQDKIKEFIKFLEDFNVDEVIFSIMEPFGILNGDRTLCVDENILDIEDNINLINSKIKISYNWNKTVNPQLCTCPAGNKILFIDNEGFVSPCTWLTKINNNFKSKINICEGNLQDILKEFNINRNCCLYDEVVYGKCK